MVGHRLECKPLSFRLLFRSPVLIFVLIVATVAVWAASVRESGAIPAFARKYNADCAMCHYPVYPRLNSFGQQFRRAGYRTPTEFGKDQDVTKIGNFLAGRIRTQLAYTDVKGEIDRTEFRLAELGLIYAGAFTRNFSGWISEKTFNGSNATFTGKVYGVFGSPDNFLSIRAGQMAMLYGEGFGGLDRPVLVSANPIYSLPLTGEPGTSPLKHTFAMQQRGAELAFVHGPGRILVQASNGLDQNGTTIPSTPGAAAGVAGAGVTPSGDIDRQKDVLVAYEHILDEIASGFTVFYYNGTTHAGVVNSLATGGPARVNRAYAWNRYGVNINKVFNIAGIGFLEFQGGYLRSDDRVPVQQAGGNIHGNAWYVESQQYIAGPELTFVERYSVIDNNVAPSNTTRKDYTIGAVTPLQTWLRLTAEYTYTDNRNTGQLAGITGHLAILEVQGVW